VSDHGVSSVKTIEVFTAVSVGGYVMYLEFLLYSWSQCFLESL